MSQRSQIFKQVGVLIYVFDVTAKDNASDTVEAGKDMEYYKNCLKALEELSPGANIFCLIHKMDLVPDSQREQVF